MTLLIGVSLLALSLLGQDPGTSPAAPATPNNYADAKAWLCRPDLPPAASACDIDHTTTVISAKGDFTREPWTANKNAPIDCFYIYPTVSTDPTPNSDMIADPAERNVVKQQFSRFGSACRPFAPLYRQVTLVGLRRAMAGNGRAQFEKGVQYDDVRDAFREVELRHTRGKLVLRP